jgi:very-short-patch-repair endonuclease
VPSPKTRAKKQRCQKSSARGNFKTTPKQEKITNVLLRANYFGGVQMKSHDEIGDFRVGDFRAIDIRGGRTSMRTIHRELEAR